MNHKLPGDLYLNWRVLSRARGLARVQGLKRLYTKLVPEKTDIKYGGATVAYLLRSLRGDERSQMHVLLSQAYFAIHG